MLDDRDLEYLSWVATLAEHGHAFGSGRAQDGSFHDEVYDRLVALVAKNVEHGVAAATAQQSIATELLFPAR